MVIPRRSFLIASLGYVSACASAPQSTPKPPPPLGNPQALHQIEARTGGRLGVCALATANERQLLYRADERFAMCSTFKWLLAAAVLAKVDEGRLALDERVTYGPNDLLEYAPATQAAVATGFMTLEALAKASVTVSDNTAANLLLPKIGGPAGFTSFVRSLGDSVTRLDRLEPELNENHPSDPRDTTSPRSMVALMRRVLCSDDVLSPSAKSLLLKWLRDCETGKQRLRAGFPHDWQVGDKTGTGPNSTVNDVAIASPPAREPVLVAVYISGASAPFDVLEAAHAEVARHVVAEL